MSHAPISLGDLAVALGLSVPRMRALRKEILTEGVDYRHQGNQILISPSGAEKLRAHLLALPAQPEAPEALPAQEPAPKMARVLSRPRDFGGVRKHFPNPTVVRCELDDAPGVPVFVRVRHSQNYAPMLRNGDPMVLEVEERGGQWVALGRAPRFPGRW